MRRIRPMVRSRSREGEERGAVLVEVTILLPVVVLLVFGIIEFSFALQGSASVSDAVRAGGRTGSALADEADLLEQATQATTARMIDVRGVTPEELWIYNANAAGYPGGNNTLEGSAAVSDCDSSANDPDRGCVRFVWNDSTSSWDLSGGSWDTDDMEPDEFCDETPEEIGVYVKARYTFLTGLFWRARTLDDRAVFRFEPQAVCN